MQSSAAIMSLGDALRIFIALPLEFTVIHTKLPRAHDHTAARSSGVARSLAGRLHVNHGLDDVELGIQEAPLDDRGQIVSLHNAHLRINKDMNVQTQGTAEPPDA